MMRFNSLCTTTLAAFALATASASAVAVPFFFSNGDVDGRLGAASRPDSAISFEIEAADDFTLSTQTRITQATFIGLLPAGAPISGIAAVAVEIYRVFPQDSDVGRTNGPPTFGTAQVPTRVNSPSDVAFDGRDSTAGDLSFTTALLTPSFSTLNSVQPGGIHPIPNTVTGGNGAVTGEEVEFTVLFSTPFDLAAGHYFFVPQVSLSLASGGDFLWLSSVRPIVAPGTPFAPDLQAWTRDQFLDPDWLRIGTDIVGGNSAAGFNLAFTLTGNAAAVPEPPPLLLVVAAGLMLVGWRWQRRALIV